MNPTKSQQPTSGSKDALSWRSLSLLVMVLVVSAEVRGKRAFDPIQLSKVEGHSLAAQSADPRVRVKIFSSETEIQVQGTSLRVIINDQSRLRTNEGSFFWSAEDRAIRSLKMEGHNLLVNGRALPSKAWAHRKEAGFEVVAEVPLELYVFGVLISEMPVSWPLEALKSQAIAIRSYTLARLREAENETFALESTVMDQVFRGFHKQDIFTLKNATARQAITETEGVVLIDSESQSPVDLPERRKEQGVKPSRILKAFYHADCGGETIPPEQVWRSPSEGDWAEDRKNGSGTSLANKSVVAKDLSCANRKTNRWELKIGSDQLPKELASKGLRWKDAAWNFGPSGRLNEIVFGVQTSLKKVWTAQDLRAFFGFTKIKSTRFQVELQGSEVAIRGQGFGHGAGLCQWGSRDWALQGRDHRFILAHYFPSAELRAPPRGFLRWAGAEVNDSRSL